MTITEIKQTLHTADYNFLQGSQHLGRNIILLTL